MASGRGDHGQFAQTNVAIWVLVGSSAAFLAVRLWCRRHLAQLWWDDYVLTTAWALLLIAGALISRTMAVGSATDDAKRTFFLLQNTSTEMTMVATSWAKIAFAITLTRLVRNRAQAAFLWFIIISANLILIPGTLSVWIPACVDPRAKFRPEHHMCYDLKTLQYLGGTTIVYGGVVDVLLALFPWLVVRELQLQKREKVGLAIAMSLGALTGVITILRAFFQFVQGDNDFEFLVFMSIFNFLEPAATIIAQAIPIFRVLLVGAKRSLTGRGGGTSRSRSGTGGLGSRGRRGSLVELEQLKGRPDWLDNPLRDDVERQPQRYGFRSYA